VRRAGKTGDIRGWLDQTLVQRPGDYEFLPQSSAVRERRRAKRLNTTVLGYFPVLQTIY